MLAYILAIAVGLGSLAFYLAAFFFPEVHRRYDFIWGGVGLVYALVLWICARRMTGGVLIGQTAAVSLIGWLGWQTLTLRRAKTPAGEQTTVSPDVAEKTKGSFLEPLTNLFRGSKSKPVPTPSENAAPATPVAEEPVAPTIAETVENFEPAAMGVEPEPVAPVVEESAPPEVTETVAEPEPAATVVEEPPASGVTETLAEPEPAAPVAEEPTIPEATETVVEDETIPAEPFVTVEIPEAESTPDLEEDEPTASEIPLEEESAADEEPEAAVEELTPEFDAEAMTEADVEELTPEFDAEAMTESDVEALTPEFDADAMADASALTPPDEDSNQ